MKYKKIPNEYLVTILDRLTRFEPAYIRYKRVFDDIINKFLLDEKLKNLCLTDEISLVEKIINNSLEVNNNSYTSCNNLNILEDKYFYCNELSYQYLSSRIDLYDIYNNIKNKENLPINCRWIKYLNDENIIECRKKYSLLYPIELIILCEGQTEFILLETIFNLFNIDLKKEGILVIQAGGKNQVAKKYYQMIEYTKLPFFILLDKDAQETKQLIEPKLRNKDRLYLLESGEFEDLIPKNVLLNVINFIHKNEYNCTINDFSNDFKMAQNIENIYKKYGFGEFKKAHFALALKDFLTINKPINDLLNSEITIIVNSLQECLKHVKSDYE